MNRSALYDDDILEWSEQQADGVEGKLDRHLHGRCLHETIVRGVNAQSAQSVCRVRDGICRVG